MRYLLPLALLASSSAFAQTAPTSVLWYAGNGGQPVEQDVVARIQSLGGTVVTRTDWATVTLSDYRAVILARPTQAFTADQIADLQAWVDDLQVLVIAGDGGNVAGLVTTVNDLAYAGTPNLGLGMGLEDTAVSAPDQDLDGNPDCSSVPITAANPFIPSTTVPAVETMGSITITDATVATVFADRQFANVTYNLGANNRNTVLVSDFSQFRDDGCGTAAKLALWDSIYERHCDRDDDGFLSVPCGGFDCDDTTPNDTVTFQYADEDGDGHGGYLASCEPSAVPSSDDCDDSNFDVNPEAEEVCDGIDNDCDNDVDADDDDVTGAVAYYPDTDGDGYGRSNNDPRYECEAPEGAWIDNNGDCDDGDEEINPGADERCANNEDDNCDGEVDEGCDTQVPTPTGVTPTGGDGGTCGCSSSAPGAGWLFAGLGLLLAGRRR
ncbi:MAG: putative metal-binding motif-containing protein [Alphaproteobacteria bacterium]|nr:putative metal-binding motif-containing protein [Alphaproteobacteria bacterium]